MDSPVPSRTKQDIKLLIPTVASLLISGMLCGCTLGPRYKRPAVAIPATYRDATPQQDNASMKQLSLADRKWSAVFRDKKLQSLIQEALKDNYDIRIAAQRVLEEEAQAGITRSEMLPSVGAGGSYISLGLPSGALGNFPMPSTNRGGLSGNAAWNLDFWGLYRKQNEAARARVLATEWGRRAVVTSVVTRVASAYIQLRGLDAQLAITREAVASRKESLRLVQLREKTGATTMADVHEAEQLLYVAEAEQPRLEQHIRQLQNDISLLLGRNPGPIIVNKAPADYQNPEAIPPGLPSKLLERRPDIRQAEAKLIAANALIGAARAQFFPQISLTAQGGAMTNQLSHLLSSDSTYWLANGNIRLPLFSGGKLRNNLRLAKEARKEMVLHYQKTIASAFRDVANALIACQKSREERIAQEKQTVAARNSVHIAQIRYENGRSSYLAVLTNETNFFTAQLNLVAAREQERLTMVQLYDALGGGWK